jgi:hypothetical protein
LITLGVAGLEEWWMLPAWESGESDSDRERCRPLGV